MRDAIEFLLDGKRVSLRDVDPTQTVLQFLREDAVRVGTKEGCAEGDCGACTVVLGEPAPDSGCLRYRAVNACIQFLPTLHGKELITVESLAAPGQPLHPVQRAMVDCHASQCGFCTPGFVMSLFALFKSARRPSRREVDVALAGNLCRCTGYRPIIEAAQRMVDYVDTTEATALTRLRRPYLAAADAAPDELQARAALDALGADEALHIAAAGKHYFGPVSADELATLVARYPEACLLAGGTDVGLWVTKQHRDLETLIYLGNVRDLQSAALANGCIDIGAAVTLSDAMPVIIAHYPDLRELFERFASPPIRNAGTVCGNIANGSPIGDCMPVLIALGARVVLRRGAQRRELPLEDFYLGYQQTVLIAGEFLERVRIPLPRAGQVVRTYKLSKRFDQDISAVCAAFSLLLTDGRVGQVRIAYGGVAATPKRARQCEEVLRNGTWDEAAVDAAMAALDRDFSPIDDMRASADYRRRTTRNLLRRFYLATHGEAGASGVYDYGR